MAETKDFVISFVPLFSTVKTKRAKRAVNFVKKFMFKHFRAKEETVLISNLVNQKIWEKGMEKIPRKIEVKGLQEDGFTKVFLKDEKIPEKKKAEKKKSKEKDSTQKTEAKPVKDSKTKDDKAESVEESEEVKAKKKLEEKKKREKASEKSAIKRGKGK